MTDYRAKTLKEAFRLCNVDPLSGEGLERYYVDLADVRKTEAIDGVSTILDFQEPGEFSTILFTGHRGCGKSTELKRICSRWEQDYRVIYLEANEETDINDAEYTDIYLIAEGVTARLKPCQDEGFSAFTSEIAKTLIRSKYQ